MSVALSRAMMNAEVITPTGDPGLPRLDSKTLFSVDIDAFISEIWVERERRLREWADAGWTQQQIADEIGRGQKTVSRWMERFDIEPASAIGRARKPLALVTATKAESDDLEPTADQVRKRVRPQRPGPSMWREINTPRKLKAADKIVNQLRERMPYPEYPDISNALGVLSDDEIGDLIRQLSKGIRAASQLRRDLQSVLDRRERGIGLAFDQEGLAIDRRIFGNELA